MRFLYPSFLIYLAVATVFGLILAGFAWCRRSVRGSLPFIALTLSTSLWSLGHLFELQSKTLPTRVLWARMKIFGIEAIQVMWLFFVLEITDKAEQLSTRHRAALLAGPLAAILLVWSNEYRGLLWQEVELQFRDSLSVIDVTYGIDFWAQSFLAYSYLIVGTLLLARVFAKAQAHYKSQVCTLLIPVFAPWTANAMYISGLNLNRELDRGFFLQLRTEVVTGGQNGKCL